VTLKPSSSGLPIADVDLAGDSGGDKGGPAFGGLIELAGDFFEEMFFRVLRVEFAVFLPLLVLGILHETEDVFFV